MKRTFSVIAFFLILYAANAQDTILKVNGNKTIAKILEISSTQIKYKKFDLLDGPTYVEDRTGIRSITYSNGVKEEITSDVPVKSPIVTIKETPTAPAQLDNNADYYGGPVIPKSKIKQRGSAFMYDGRRLNEKKIHLVLQETKDKEIINLVQQSKDAHKLKYIGFGAIPLGLASIIVLSSGFNPNNGKYTSGSQTASAVLFVAAMACPAISTVFSVKRKNCNKKAIQLYNERY